MRWAILALFAAGCGQAAATAPVAIRQASVVSTQPIQAAQVAEAALAQLPAGPSPRGWLVEFTGGPLDRQSGIVPRDYSAAPPAMGGISGAFGARYPTTVSITPSGSVLRVTFSGEGSGGYGSVSGTGTSFSGGGTFVGPNGTAAFSATVTEIP